MASTQGITAKEYLQLNPPTEEDSRSDQQRILDALTALGYAARLSLSAMRKLHSICPQANWQLTVSLALSTEDTAHPLWIITDIEAGDQTAHHYGYAIDLGSTTVVIRLIDLAGKRLIDQVSVFNHQIAYGEDILSRIFYSKDQEEKIEEIRQATLRSIQEGFALLAKKTGISSAQCISAVLAGNSCMIHFLLGLDAFCVFSSPYALHADIPGFISGHALGLDLPGFVYIYPSLANYIGGDTISGMIAVEMFRSDKLSVFFDVGTNGELVVGSKDFLLCGAGAAGPALEGGSVITGMKASSGAIEKIAFDGEIFSFETINHASPVGICGSGIVDLISELFMHGLIDLTGRFRPEASSLIVQRPMPDAGVSQYAIEYAPELWFYQQDIDEFIRTKSAAFTMMDYMLSAAGIGMADINSFYMCGSFGAHINIEHAVNIGMYPDVAPEKIVLAGNTSLEGCTKLLTDRSLLQDVAQILDLMTYIQYGAIDDFLERMHASSALPHTDMRLFPSVAERLKHFSTKESKQ